MKKRLFAAVLGTAMTLSVFCGGSYASESRNNYIVRLNGGEAEKAAGEISAVIPGIRVGYVYDKLICGFSAEMTESDAKKLSGFYNVASVKRSAVYLFEDETVDDEMSGDEDVMSDDADYGYTGAGQVVAVIDCGVNTDDPHFALSAKGEENAKLGRGDVENAELSAEKANYVSSKIPFAYDYYDNDTDIMSDASHAMNIATLIGANGEELDDGYSGIAPDCQLLLMKVFDDSGEYAMEESIIAALEDAYALGADVVNLSFGSPCGDSEGNPLGSGISDAVKKLCENNVSVVCAAGNNGRTGVYTAYDDLYGISDPTVMMVENGTIASPASIPETVAVGSYAAFGYYIPVILLSDGSEIEYEDTSDEYFRESFISRFDGEALEYVIVDGIGTEDDIAAAGDLTGKIAVITRGEITFSEKCANAAAAGAVGVIIVNTDPLETVMMDLSEAPIPAISVSGESGEMMMNAEKKAVYIALGQFSSAGESTRISYNPSSSWGPTPELGLKPDLIAPGYHIGAVGMDGKIEYSDGTSIAAAYVSGVMALLGEKLSGEGIDSAELKKTLLMNSAVSLTGDRESSYSPASYSPRAQGAGMIDSGTISAALSADTVITPSISLGDELGRLFRMSLSITNNSEEDRRYLVAAEILADSVYDAGLDPDELGYEPPMFFGTQAIGIAAAVRVGDDNNEINIQNENYNGKTVTIRAGETAELTIRVMIPDELYESMMEQSPYGRFIDGYISLDDLGASGGAPLKSYSMPFMGFLSDWEAAPAADPSIYETSDNAYYGSYMYTDTYIEGVTDTAILGGSYYYPSEYRSDLCVFSPNGDSRFDYAMMQLNMLRNAVDCRYTIYDADGKIVYTVTNEAVMNRSYITENDDFYTYNFYLWDGTAEDNGFYIYPDGEYTVIFEFFMYDGSVQTQTYTLNVDTAAPVITEKNIFESDGRKILRLNVSDEFALDYIDLFYLTKSSSSEEDYEEFEREEIPDDDEELDEYLEEYYDEYYTDESTSVTYYGSYILHDTNGEYADLEIDCAENDDGSITVEIDITDIDTEKLYIYVYDYAMNRAVDMMLPG